MATATDVMLVGVVQPVGWVTERVVEPVASGVKVTELPFVPAWMVTDAAKVPAAGLVFPKDTASGPVARF
jgi:hypothetical protein